MYTSIAQPHEYPMAIRNDVPMFERYNLMLADIDRRLGVEVGYSQPKMFMVERQHGTDYYLTAEVPGGFNLTVRNDVTQQDAVVLGRMVQRSMVKIKASRTNKEPLRKLHGRELAHETLALCKMQMQATTIKEVAMQYGFTFVTSENRVMGYLTIPVPMSFHLEPTNTDGYFIHTA